jgi:hypothetical protein
MAASTRLVLLTTHNNGYLGIFSHRVEEVEYPEYCSFILHAIIVGYKSEAVLHPCHAMPCHGHDSQEVQEQQLSARDLLVLSIIKLFL